MLVFYQLDSKGEEDTFHFSISGQWTGGLLLSNRAEMFVVVLSFLVPSVKLSLPFQRGSVGRTGQW